MRYSLIGSGGPKPVAIRIFAVVTFAFALLLHMAATVKAQPVCTRVFVIVPSIST